MGAGVLTERLEFATEVMRADATFMQIRLGGILARRASTRSGDHF
jgi:hypothetical protein